MLLGDLSFLFFIYRYFYDELLVSPSLVQVTSTDASAEQTFSVGTGLTVGEAGHPLVFQIVLADIFGNRIVTPLPEVYPSIPKFHLVNLRANASLSIPKLFESIVPIVPVLLSFDMNDGLLRALASPIVSGTYDLDVTFKPNHTCDNSVSCSLSRTNIHGSAFQV